MLRPIESIGPCAVILEITGEGWGLKYASEELDRSFDKMGVRTNLRGGQRTVPLTGKTVCSAIALQKALTRHAKHFAKDYNVQITWTWQGEAADIDWAAAAQGTTATEDREIVKKITKKSALNRAGWMRALEIMGVTTATDKTLKGGFRAEIPGIEGDCYAESYGALIVYGDSHAEDERTAAAREWARAQAHVLLGTTPKATDGRPERARDYMTDLSIRTCPCCFRDIKASAFTQGRIADHGFNIQHGWRNGHCEGTGELPWERSCEPAKEEILRLLARSASLVDFLTRLQEGKVDTLVGQDYNYKTHRYDPITITPADGYRWSQALAATIRDTELKLGALWSGFYGSVPWTRMAVRTWQPVADDVPAVGAPFNDLVDSDWEGKPSIIG